MRLTILLLFISCSVFSQLDSIQKNVLYVDYSPRVSIFIDSINDINGYPRQGALTYIDYSYDEVLGKYTLLLNKVTERYLAKVILDAFEFPVIRIPKSVISPAIKTKLENEIINNNWNLYWKNSNLWMFNYSHSADDEFTQNQINWITSNGGAVWNFD
jgi:hypothetical protein